MRLFLDTEFSWFEEDPDRMELISIALASSDGREFYGELSDFSRHACSAFVAEHVLPQLGRNPANIFIRAELVDALLTWLHGFEPGRVKIAYAYAGDATLMRKLLGNRMPAWIQFENVDRDIDADALQGYLHASHKPQHHALYNARAMRAAFRVGAPGSMRDAVGLPAVTVNCDMSRAGTMSGLGTSRSM